MPILVVLNVRKQYPDSGSTFSTRLSEPYLTHILSRGQTILCVTSTQNKDYGCAGLLEHKKEGQYLRRGIAKGVLANVVRIKSIPHRKQDHGSAMVPLR